MQWVMGAVAASAAPERGGRAFAADARPSEHETTPTPIQTTPVPQELAAEVKPSDAVGYGLDPDLVKLYKPGDVWPLTMTPPQRKATTALANLILPKDQYGPSAEELNVPAMMDEWVSAPYPQQQRDRQIVLKGLAWLDAESAGRFKKVFADLDAKQRAAIVDDICDAKAAKKQFKEAARFFSRFRGIACGAYYASPPGWEALGYVGNVALGSFDGPPPEVLQKLGVEQTVR